MQPSSIMKPRVFRAFASLAVTAVVAAEPLLTDDFNATAIDTSKWTVTLPFSDSYATQENGYIQLEDGARITSIPSFSGAIEITGRIQISNNEFNNSKLVLRTDGVQYAAEVKGVAIQFSPRKDYGAYEHQLDIFTIGEITQTNVSFTTPINLDTWYDFRVIDTGDTIYLFWEGATTTPTLTYTTSYGAGDKISFYSRHGAGDGSFISDNGRGRLDHITVQTYETFVDCETRAAALEIEVTELLAQEADASRGLDEILRLLDTPPGKRKSTVRVSGPLGVKINQIIDRLVK
jgi:hypothetical protein